MTTTTRDASRSQRGRGLIALLDFGHVSHTRAARRAEAIGSRYAQAPRIEAFNFSAGRTVTLAVYRSEAAQ